MEWNCRVLRGRLLAAACLLLGRDCRGSKNKTSQAGEAWFGVRASRD